MYTVLVVDDEELICQGIKSMIERINHPEISEVFIADNALKAKLIIRDLHPSIVITDIQMPGVSGLEMIRSSNSEPNKIKFIVLSGYDDFQYVRESLKLGVMDYLLKPASMFELSTVIDNAVLSLNMEKRNSGYEDELKYWQKFLENNLRRVFMYKSVDDFDVIVIFDRIRKFFQYESFTIGIVRFMGNSGSGESGSSEGTGFGEEGNSISGPGWQAIGFVNDNGDEAVVVNHASALQSTNISAITKDLVCKKENCPGNGMTVALSNSSCGIESLIVLYRQAEKSLSYKLIMSQAEVIDFASIKDKPIDTAYSDRMLNELRELLKFPKEEKISSYIDDVFSLESLSNRSIDCTFRLYIGTCRQLTGMASAGQQMLREEFSRPFESFTALRDIRIYLKEAAYQSIKTLKEEGIAKTVIASTMNYVRENLGKDISLAVAANRANVSYTHFSRLFKKQTGMNFSEYLTKARMEEGKRMLDDPALKIYEIAGKVGYSDPKHFTRAFRLFYGISPMEYRSKTVSLHVPYPH